MGRNHSYQLSLPDLCFDRAFREFALYIFFNPHCLRISSDSLEIDKSVSVINFVFYVEQCFVS